MLTAPALFLGLTLGIAPMLEMEPVFHQDNWVLILRDCGYADGLDSSTDCEEWETGFKGPGTLVDTRTGRHYYRWRDKSRDPFPYEGDAPHLRKLLRERRYAEVWLISGGGNLDQGLEVGRVLREAGITVRVPGYARLSSLVNGPQLRTPGMCASSCTVAFMGGLFRYVDPGAPFLVHSASAVSGSVGASARASFESGDIGSLAIRQQRTACLTGLRLIRHFQNGLLQLVHQDAQPEHRTFLEQKAASDCNPGVPYTDSQAATDRARYELEGIGAAQDIVMRVERDAMRAALDAWTAQMDSLGPRAEPAIRMVEAMYDVVIKETAGLTQETLLRMGYVTQEAGRSPPPPT